MDSPSLPQSLSKPLVPKEPFKKWVAFTKALRNLPHPVPEGGKREFLERIQHSPQRLQIAFEFLWWIQGTKGATKYSWLVTPMVQVLSGGDESPRLATLPNPADAAKWVFQQLKEVNTLLEWKDYLASGRHLWLLHCVLECHANRPALVEAIIALGECIAHFQNTPAAGKQRKSGIQSEDPNWIARLLKSRVPAKLDLPKAFNETLFAICATAELSEALRSEVNGLRMQLEQVRTDRDEQASARAAAESREAALENHLNAVQENFDQCRTELAEERRHTTRTGGFSDAAKRQTIAQVMSDVRRGLSARLENIRLFADREKPDGEEIVSLIKEIEDHMAKVEHRISS